jgi:hypothetical protein
MSDRPSPSDPSAAPPFKVCPQCGRVWETLEDFLADEHLRVTGYQARLEDFQRGWYLFNHLGPDCLTTLAVPVVAFEPLFAAPRPARSLAGTRACECRCLTPEDLGRCQADCTGAPYREVLAMLVARLGTGTQTGEG